MMLLRFLADANPNEVLLLLSTFILDNLACNMDKKAFILSRLASFSLIDLVGSRSNTVSSDLWVRVRKLSASCNDSSQKPLIIPGNI